MCGVSSAPLRWRYPFQNLTWCPHNDNVFPFWVTGAHTISALCMVLSWLRVISFHACIEWCSAKNSKDLSAGHWSTLCVLPSTQVLCPSTSSYLRLPGSDLFELPPPVPQQVGKPELAQVCLLPFSQSCAACCPMSRNHYSHLFFSWISGCLRKDSKYVPCYPITF